MFERKVGLKIRKRRNKTVIKFPVNPWTIALWCMFLFSAAGSITTASIMALDLPTLILISFLAVLLLSSFAMVFLRNVTIDRDKRVITYFSFWKRSCGFDEIAEMYTHIEEGVGGRNDKCYLIIKTKNGTTKIKTQSGEQGKLLMGEIMLNCKGGGWHWRP